MAELNIAPEPARGGGFIDPADGDLRQIHQADRALEVIKVTALIEGDTAQSVTFEVRHGPNITLAGSEIVSEVTTNNTTGEEFTVITSASIPAGDVIWVVITTVAGVVRTFLVTLDFG